MSGTRWLLVLVQLLNATIKDPGNFYFYPASPSLTSSGLLSCTHKKPAVTPGIVMVFKIAISIPRRLSLRSH